MESKGHQGKLSPGLLEAEQMRVAVLSQHQPGDDKTKWENWYGNKLPKKMFWENQKVVSNRLLLLLFGPAATVSYIKWGRKGPASRTGEHLGLVPWQVRAPLEEPCAISAVDTGIRVWNLFCSADFIYALVLTKERNAWKVIKTGQTSQGWYDEIDFDQGSGWALLDLQPYASVHFFPTFMASYCSVWKSATPEYLIHLPTIF